MLGDMPWPPASSTRYDSKPTAARITTQTHSRAVLPRYGGAAAEGERRGQETDVAKSSVTHATVLMTNSASVVNKPARDGDQTVQTAAINVAMPVQYAKFAAMGRPSSA